MEKRIRRTMFICILSITFTVFASEIVPAQEFPTKPITLVNPGGPGGSHDLTARAVTSVAPDYIGQPIIIKNMPGAQGAIGSEFVAKAAPDGYTLCFGGPGYNTTLPAVEKGLSKGPDDLTAVCRINYSAMHIVVQPETPYKTFKEMVEWGKANPGKLIFGTTGLWGPSDLPWKQICANVGMTTKMVPFDGGGGVLVAIMGGHVDAAILPGATTIPLIKTGKLRALGFLDDKRDPNLPNVPTAKEQGVPVSYQLWRGVLAPKAVPRPTIDRLAAAFKKMSEDKSVVAMIKQFGDSIQFLGPDEFTKVWRQEYEVHRELGKLYKK